MRARSRIARGAELIHVKASAGLGRRGSYVSTLVDEVLADITAHRRLADGPWYLHAGPWIAATYRLGRAAHRAPRGPVRFGLLAAHRVLSAPFRALLAVHIPHNAMIGAGLCLPHARNIILPPGGRFGRDCVIHHEVTVGRGTIEGVPMVGDGVTLWPGARLLGGVTVGDGVEIGPNAVVSRSLPAGATVASPPCRVIPADMAARLVPKGRREHPGAGARRPGSLVTVDSPGGGSTAGPSSASLLDPGPPGHTSARSEREHRSSAAAVQHVGQRGRVEGDYDAAKPHGDIEG